MGVTTTRLDKDSARIRRMFGGIAPTYDLLNRVLSLRIDQSWRRETVRQALKASDRRVLDLACGTGDLTFALARAAKPGARVVGADFTGPMLELAHRKNGTRRIAWVQGDGMKLPFPDSSFDLVTIAFGLRNMADFRQALREIRRVIRPGGRLAVLEFTQPPNPLFRALYHFYFIHVLTRIGAWVSGSRAYHYLVDSVLDWPGPGALARHMKVAGFDRVRHRILTFGIAALHIAERRA